MEKPIADWEKKFFDNANVLHASLHAVLENKGLCKKHFLKQLEEFLNTVENTIEDISLPKKILLH